MVSTEPKTRATIWLSLLWGLTTGIFCCLLEGDDKTVCGRPRWKAVWNDDTGADILLASYWSHLQSDWFCVMPVCPAETRRLRHDSLFVSSSSLCAQRSHDNEHPERCRSYNGWSFVPVARCKSLRAAKVWSAAKWVRAWRKKSVFMF